jgi:hypothetical protein
MSYTDIGTPYPLSGATWTDYGQLAGTPTYPGGTTEIIMDAAVLQANGYEFAYNETYWVKIEEVNNPKQFHIKNITIHDAIAFQMIPVSPPATASPTPTPTVTSSQTPVATQSPTPTVTPSQTPGATQSPTPTVTPSETVTPTPTVTPSETVTPTPTPTPTTTIVTVNISNTSTPSNDMDITDVKVNGNSMIGTTTPGFNYVSGSNPSGTGPSPMGPGTWNIVVTLSGPNISGHNIVVTDSLGVSVCQDVDAPGDFTFNSVVTNSSLAVTITLSDGACV